MPLAIHRVTQLDMRYRRWTWSFAVERRADIDAHFALKRAEKPKLWNGRILLARNPVFTTDRFSADYFETDFASFLAWRDWGFADKGVFNGHGMGALRGNDGVFVLGEMAAHTANAGRIYFPAGTPDLDDLRDTTVDIAGSIAREVEEETGLGAADYRADGPWHCVVSDGIIAIIRILDVDLPGEAVRAKIGRNLAEQQSPEFSAIHLVRGLSDFTPAMPRFVAAFIEAQLAS
jgi:8-oxo-dGTP pyrophosphatase MutT (NUDIX family)